MSQFLRLLTETDKAEALARVCTRFREGVFDSFYYEVAPESFNVVPGRPFAYWVSEDVRSIFKALPKFQSNERIAASGGKTLDDFRFVRASWEVSEASFDNWRGYAKKGGKFSTFYSDVHLYIDWRQNALSLKAYLIDYRESRGWSPNWTAELHSYEHYFRPGITWPRRTQQFGPRIMPRNCIFGDKGPAAFVRDDNPLESLCLLSLMTSKAFNALVELSLNAGDRTARSFEVGVIQQTPVPVLSSSQQSKLASFASSAWSLKRTLDTIDEISHAFILPAALRSRLGDYQPLNIEIELARIQNEIDEIAFDLYGFSETDRMAVLADNTSDIGVEETNSETVDEDSDDENGTEPIDLSSGLLAWTVGVAFGRFDWRLATGERDAPPEPAPFDPLPVKSPGMLPDGAEPFHAHSGILVDDQGHPHDLACLIEEVLVGVDVTVPDDVRRWLQRTSSRSTYSAIPRAVAKRPFIGRWLPPLVAIVLWVYYPSLTNQTLYTAINDFLDGPNGKLTQVSQQVSELRNKAAARTRDDEKQFESLLTFELELIELRDTLLKLAPTYKPNHDDGVQITAAPLWPLFRHKPWQKVLKDTWSKLEKGDYDWAHLAMNYWPERVREKCKSDKSLAIAHGLENLYVEPETKPKTARGKKKSGDAL